MCKKLIKYINKTFKIKSTLPKKPQIDNFEVAKKSQDSI